MPQPQFLTPQEVAILAASNYENLAGLFPAPNQLLIISDAGVQGSFGTLTQKVELYTLSEVATNINEGLQGSSTIAIYLPEGIETLQDGFLANCLDLEFVKLPSTLTAIPDGFASAAEALASIVIPNSVVSIGYEAFVGCQALTEIIIPEGVTIIHAGTFAEDTNLRSVKLPNSLLEIESGAFAACENLDLVIPDTVTTIASDAFTNVPHITYHGQATGAPWGALSMN